MKGRFLMCGPALDARRTAVRMARTYGVPNVFFDTTTMSSGRFGELTIESLRVQLLDAVKEFDGLFGEMGLPVPAEYTADGNYASHEPMGEIYINLVDLMERTGLDLFATSMEDTE